MWKVRLVALAILLAGFGVGYFVYASTSDPEPRFPFKFGLDLAGGTHLIYRADTSGLTESDIPASMQALRDTIERRVNLFGVAEPIVQTEQSGIFSGAEEERLIVELPGVTDTEEAIRLIGGTPVLEFKLLVTEAGAVDEEGTLNVNADYQPTGLTGRYVEHATLQFGSQGNGGLSNEPLVVLDFNGEGTQLFADITREHVGKVVGIFLDGALISAPVVQEPITDGTAVISGNFQPDEARELVRNLNYGALPVPIELVSSQTIGATLGGEALDRGIVAGVLGLILVSLFMIVWYRLPGAVAILSLATYLAIMLAIFKLIPVTLTAAGIAGFILSIGMAVDANVLIFERLKEELKEGKNTKDAIDAGFTRAWTSIRDGNITSILSAIILFWFGTSLIEGFAVTFGLGVIVSMLTAITVSRVLLYALGNYRNRRLVRALYGSGTYFK